MISYLFTACVKDFLFHCEFEKRLSQQTITAYKTDLRQCEEFLALELGADFLLNQVEKEKIKFYLQSLKDWKPKTIKRKIAALKSMLSFVEYERDDYINPFRRLRFRIKEPVYIPVTMSIDEVGQVLNAAYSKLECSKSATAYTISTSKRAIAIIELLFVSGIRVSELCTLTRSNLNLNTGTLLIQGKGNKERLLHICQERVLDSLKSYRESLSAEHSALPYFFVNRLGRRISTESVRVTIRAIVKAAGLKKHVTPHTFRHSFATLILEEGVDIRYIQAFLGHSSIVTTQLYTRVNNSQQRHILATKHPRMRLEI